MEYLLSIALFAVSTSVTPGPNNIMVMTSALNYGIRRSLPLLLGICVGFTIMLLLVGLGFAQIFVVYPNVILIIKVIGTAYLLYLAMLIANSKFGNIDVEEQKPLSFLTGALFQWVNGKAWVVVIGAISAFAAAGETYIQQTLIIAFCFLIISIPSVGIWLFFGSFLKKKLKNEPSIRAFNFVMALLLVLSVLPVCIEIWKEVELLV